MNNQICFSACQEMYMKSRAIIKITIIINNTLLVISFFKNLIKTQLFLTKMEQKLIHLIYV